MPSRTIILKQPHHDSALLVLVGLGNMTANWSHIAEGFSRVKGMDIYLPDYIA